MQAKNLLRQRMQRLRGSVPTAIRQQRDERVVMNLACQPWFTDAAVVASFVAIGSEVNVAALLDAAQLRRQVFALPRIDLESRSLTLHRYIVGDPLEPGYGGIPQPSTNAPVIDPKTLDVIIVPALAVDTRGHRVGYGGGYYDRLLPLCTKAVRCAIAYDFQLVVEAPNTPSDQTVHWLVTDQRVLRASPER